MGADKMGLECLAKTLDFLLEASEAPELKECC